MTLAIPVEPTLERTPGPLRPALSEAVLFRGYSTDRRTVIRSEPCACGSLLVQYEGEEGSDVHADHVRTEVHEAWSAQTREL